MSHKRAYAYHIVRLYVVANKHTPYICFRPEVASRAHKRMKESQNEKKSHAHTNIQQLPICAHTHTHTQHTGTHAVEHIKSLSSIALICMNYTHDTLTTMAMELVFHISCVPFTFFRICKLFAHFQPTGFDFFRFNLFVSNKEFRRMLSFFCASIVWSWRIQTTNQRFWSLISTWTIFNVNFNQTENAFFHSFHHTFFIRKSTFRLLFISNNIWTNYPTQRGHIQDDDLYNSICLSYQFACSNAHFFALFEKETNFDALFYIITILFPTKAYIKMLVLSFHLS